MARASRQSTTRTRIFTKASLKALIATAGKNLNDYLGGVGRDGLASNASRCHSTSPFGGNICDPFEDVIQRRFNCLAELQIARHARGEPGGLRSEKPSDLLDDRHRFVDLDQAAFAHRVAQLDLARPGVVDAAVSGGFLRAPIRQPSFESCRTRSAETMSRRPPRLLVSSWPRPPLSAPTECGIAAGAAEAPPGSGRPREGPTGD